MLKGGSFLEAAGACRDLMHRLMHLPTLKDKGLLLLGYLG